MTQLLTDQTTDTQIAPEANGDSPITLDNGIIVQVSKMPEHEALRAASIFDPEQAERISSVGDGDVNVKDLLTLWKGNERYLLYIVECSCKLVSPLPKDDSWLSRYRRHADLYGIKAEDLVYMDYMEAVYIRYMGMTSDVHITKVSDRAMGIKQEDKPMERRTRRLK